MSCACVFAVVCACVCPMCLHDVIVHHCVMMHDGFCALLCL